jgi:hypothetical protein
MIRKVKPLLFDTSNSYALPLYEITDGQLAEAYLVLTSSGFLYATNHIPDNAIYIWYVDQQFTADELNDILQDEEIIDYCQKILDGEDEYDELHGEVEDLIYKRNPKHHVYNDIIKWLVKSEFSDRFADVWPPDKTIDEAINDIIEKAHHNEKVPAIIVDANAKEKLLELAYSIYQDEPGELSNTHINELIRNGYIVNDKQERSEDE